MNVRTELLQDTDSACCNCSCTNNYNFFPSRETNKGNRGGFCTSNSAKSFCCISSSVNPSSFCGRAIINTCTPTSRAADNFFRKSTALSGILCDQNRRTGFMKQGDIHFMREWSLHCQNGCTGNQVPYIFEALRLWAVRVDRVAVDNLESRYRHLIPYFRL